jgi:hypothetical protein
MNNNSKVYGTYGGVTKQNHYVPPPSIPFVPQPASVPFYENYSTAVDLLLSSAEATREFFVDNEGTIMRRYLVERTQTQEIYKLATLDHPNDVIIYTTNLAGPEDLLLMDGGIF